jgi:hypothetical protein
VGCGGWSRVSLGRKEMVGAKKTIQSSNYSNIFKMTRIDSIK